MDNAVVFGYGVVGRAVAEAFGIGKYYSRSSSNIAFDEVAKQKYIFICLPTPTINGKCFTKDIYDTIKELIAQGLSKDSVIIIRSTVTPGFNRSLQKSFGIENIVSNPEFINNDTAVEDMKNPDLVVIGGESQRHVEMVVGLYKGRFKHVEPIVTDSASAEFVKYSLNVFFATKVVFANQMFDASRRVKANYEVARRILEAHKWGSKGHFMVYHKKGRGAGGRCLPKDLEAFSNLVGPTIFDKVHSINQTYLKLTEKV